MENAPGLRTAAPSSADRGMAEAGEPRSPSPPSPGSPTARAPYGLQRPTSRHPQVSSTLRRDTPTPRISRVPAPHVSDTEVPAPSVPASAGSSPAGTGGGRAEGHLPIRARWRTGSPRAPAGRASKLPAGEPPRATRLDWSAGAAARARAPPPHLPRRCPSCLGGGGDAAARRPRPGRASGPEGKGGREEGRRRTRTRAGKVRALRCERKPDAGEGERDSG